MAATSDAVGLLEALTIPETLDLRVGIDEWQDTADLVVDRNVIIVGSGTMNIYAALLNHVFEPLHFAMPPDGRSTEPIIAGGLRNQTHFGLHADGSHDSGFIMLAKSIFNLDKSIVWIAGITGMATQAALASLKDLLTGYIAIDDRAIGYVVSPRTPRGLGPGISEYYRKWRISEYKIVHQVDADGNELIT